MREVGWLAGSSDRPLNKSASRADSNQRGPRALPRAGTEAQVERDPALELSDHQRAFIQPTLDALDSRLTSHKGRQAQAAIVAYRQKLVERAHGIDTLVQDGVQER